MARTIDKHGKCIELGDILCIETILDISMPFLIEVTYMPMSGIIAGFVVRGTLKGTFLLTASPLVTLWQRKGDITAGDDPYKQTV